MKPLLSICIPTYNRERCLKDCLGSIVGQFNDPGVLDQVEVVISDNASKDNTQVLVEGYQKKYANIKYFRNAENIGFDRNLLNVVEKSSGEFCLTIGDDDALFPGSLAKIIQKIKTMDASYFMLNCWGYNNDLSAPVVSHPNRTEKDDLIFNKLLDFVRSIDNYLDMVGFFGGMSTQLFSRKIWMDFKEKDKYIGTQTIHLHILLKAFKEQRFALLAEPFVKTRNDNMRWETYPGLETNFKRCMGTAKGVLWVANLYDLPISPLKVRIYFLGRLFWISLKEFIKGVLRFVGLRK